MPGIIRISSIYRTYLLKKVGAAVTYVRYNLVKGAKFEPELEEIEYEGDGGKTIVPYAAGFKATITADALTLTAIESIFGKTPITTGLPAGETSRLYMMTSLDQAGVAAGLYVVAQGIDDSTNTAGLYAIVSPVGTLSTLTPPALENLSAAEVEMTFAGRATASDLAGTALPGLTGGDECYYYISKLSALPA